MNELSRALLSRFPVRKSRKQKEAFLVWLSGALREAGFESRMESGGLLKSRNLVVGDPDRAALLLTAHYDTCAMLPVPNFLLPQNIPLYILYSLTLTLMFMLPMALVFWLILALTAEPALALMGAYAALLLVFWLMMAGYPNPHNANDNTSGVATLIETLLSLPPDKRAEVAVVFFDHEELGLLGSSLFRKTHPAARAGTLTLNFDCVSDGDTLALIPNKGLRAEEATLERLENAFQGTAKKRIRLFRGPFFYPSDQLGFTRGVGVAAFKYKPLVGLYLDRIHTPFDTRFDEENLRLLTEGILRLLEQ